MEREKERRGKDEIKERIKGYKGRKIEIEGREMGRKARDKGEEMRRKVK